MTRCPRNPLVAELTTLRARAERAEGALKEISCRQWEIFQPGDDTGATLPYPAVVRVVNIARRALAARGE